MNPSETTATNADEGNADCVLQKSSSFFFVDFVHLKDRWNNIMLHLYNM